MSTQTKSSATVVNVVITGEQSNRGLKATAWANNAKIKVNGEPMDVTLWTSSNTEPVYKFGQVVSCKLIRKQNGEHYFGTSYVNPEELDNVVL